MLTRKVATAIVAGGMVAACATQPENISATSVSTAQYQDYDCKQLGLELDRVNTRAGDLERSLDSEADSDAAEMAIGMVLFWPALFFLEGGDGPEANEYARLKGEREALEKTRIAKSCDVEPVVETKADSGEAQIEGAEIEKVSATAPATN